MVTKGIITAIPIGDENNKYLVRLPFFEDATQDSEEIIYEATLSEPSGIIQGYGIGDIVYCTFEDNNLGRPVIIGKLFAKGLENIGAEINTLELDVGNRANLPANTTIGNATPEDVANISTIKNKLDKMGGTIFGQLSFGNNVQYTVGKKVSIVNSSGDIIQSELTDHIFADSMTRQCSSGTNGSDDNVGYIKLCDITLTKHFQARFINFRIYVGDGQNGRTNQNAYIELLLQSGWLGSENGRFGGYWELHKLGTSLTPSKFDVVVTSNSNLQYSVWLYVNGVGYCKPTYTVWYDREMLNDPTNICTITHVGNVRQATAPEGTDPNCLMGHSTGTSVDHATSADNDGDGNNIASTYLKLTGGTMTGTIIYDLTGTQHNKNTLYHLMTLKYKSEDNSQTHTTYPIDFIGSDEAGHAYNTPLRLGSVNGATWLTSGESGAKMPTTITSYNTEKLYLSSDGEIEFYTNCSNDASSYTNTLTLDTSGNAIVNNGLLKDTKNGNTITIGSQNSNWCHIYNSADIPFIFNKTVASTNGNLGTSSYPWGKIFANGEVLISGGENLVFKASSSATNDPGDIVFTDNSGTEIGRIWKNAGKNEFLVRYSASGTGYKVMTSQNITYGTNDPSNNDGSDGDIYVQYTQ